jgi:N-acetylmuramoyl-L-alanine amidase
MTWKHETSLGQARRAALRGARWRGARALLVLALGLALPVGPTALAAGFRGLYFDPPRGALEAYRVTFDGPAVLRVHEDLVKNHYFYLDFFGVGDPGADKDWALGGAGVFHVKQIYYRAQQVLRVVFYCRSDAWFSVRTLADATHEVLVRPIRYVDLAAARGRALEGSRKRVVLDPGHGGTPEQGQYHYGARASFLVGGRYVYEKELTLQIARRLQALIAATPNMDCVMTRDQDVYVSLDDRVARARAAHGDLFLSIHLNDSGPSDDHGGRGFEIYYLSDISKQADRALMALENEGVDLDDKLSSQGSLRDLVKQLAGEAMGARREESRQLCEVIDQEFRRLGPFREHDRGVKSALFRVLMNFDMPSALAECGFLDNPTEGRMLMEPAVQERIAALLFDGVNRYFAMQDADFRPTRARVGP